MTFSPSHALSLDQVIGSNFSFQHWPLADVARLMQTFGRTRMELWGIAPHLDLFHADARRPAEVRRLLEDHGLTVHCFTPEQVVYPINIASGNDDYREASITLFCRAAEIAAELGARYLFLTAGRGYETEPAAKAQDRAADALRRIADHAARRNVRCLLEPLQRRESNIVHTAADLRTMLDFVGADTMDVVLDLVTMASAGDTIDDYLTLFGSRLAHVHLVDGTPAGHLVWGDGELPIPRYLDALARGGYHGNIAFEPFGDGSYALDPAFAFTRNMNAFSRYLAAGKEYA